MNSELLTTVIVGWLLARLAWGAISYTAMKFADRYLYRKLLGAPELAPFKSLGPPPQSCSCKTCGSQHFKMPPLCECTECHGKHRQGDPFNIPMS